MSGNLGEAILTLGADATGLDRDIAKAGAQALGALGKIGSVMKAAIPVAAIVGGAVAAGKALVDCVNAAAKEEKGIAKLAQAVKNSGADWNEAEGAIEGYLRAEMKRIGLDGGAGRDSLAALTGMTGSYQKAMEALPVAIDLAAAKGIDLATASKLVGRAYQGTTGALARYGVTLEKGAKGEAVLEALNKKFGGQAEAQANTLEGQRARLGIIIDEIKETIGGALLPVLTQVSGAIGTWLVDALPKVEEFSGKVQAAIGPIIAQAMQLGQQALTAGGQLLTAFGPQIEQATSVAREILTSLLAFLKPLLADMAGFFGEQFGKIGAWFQENMPLIQATIEIVLTRIQQIWNAVWPTLSQVLLAAWNTMKDGISTSLDVILGIIKAVMQIITGDWEGAWETIKATANTLWEGIKKIILDAINTILAFFGVKTSWGQLKDAVTKPFKEAWTFISGILDKIKAGIDTVVNWWNNLTSTAPGKPVAGTGGQYNVPGAAEGANFVAYGEQLLRVGEREPEYVSVTPLSKLGPGGPGGQTYNLNIYTSAPWEPIVADFQMLAAMGA